MNQNPLEQLIAATTKRRGCPIYKAALLRLAPYPQRLIQHLAAPTSSAQDKIPTLPRVSTSLIGAHDIAINSVLALAALTRFDDLFEDERERRGYRRTYVNSTHVDLTSAIQAIWRSQGEAGLVAFIANEVSSFLAFVQRCGDVDFAVRTRLSDFMALNGAVPASSVSPS